MRSTMLCSWSGAALAVLLAACAPRSVGAPPTPTPDADTTDVAALDDADVPAPMDTGAAPTDADDVAPPVDTAPPDTAPPVDAGPTCRSDRECSAFNQVCNRDRGVCVDCVTAVDCGDAGQMCVGSRCVTVTTCTTSRMCPGQVCDTRRGYCVDCVTDTDCPMGELCGSDAACRARVCAPGATECLDATRVRTCDARGLAWTEVLALGCALATRRHFRRS